MREHARHLLGIGLVSRCNDILHRKAAQSLAPVVSHHLNGRAQVEGAELGIGRNRQRHMATVNVFVFHAKALGAKQKGHRLLGRTGLGQFSKMLSGGSGGGAKITRRHGRCAQMRHAVECLVQRLDHPGFVEHIIGPAGPLDGFLLAQHIRPARFDQHQLVKTHHFHGPGSGAHIASMAGFYQDKSRFHAPIVHPPMRPTRCRSSSFVLLN